MIHKNQPIASNRWADFISFPAKNIEDVTETSLHVMNQLLTQGIG
jgi:hypothetical protein